MEIGVQKNRWKMGHYLAVVMLSLAVMCACQSPKKKKGEVVVENNDDETTTRGEINIGIDITMQPVLRQIVDAFSNDYKDAILHPTYAPEGVLMRQLLADSLRVIFISRELNPGEAKMIKAEQIRPTITMIAQDAVAVLINPENPMDSLKMDQLERLLKGEAKTWRDIGGDNDQEVAMVFDDPSSSTVRLLRDKFLGSNGELPSNAYVAKSQEKVIDYVRQAKNAVGFIGFCLISDRDDSTTRRYLSQVKIARLDAADTSDVPGFFVRPYQNEITLGRYPLSRPIYAVSREHFAGLGTGFVIYAAGELGQRILLKAGIVPKYMPPRLIVLPEKEE